MFNSVLTAFGTFFSRHFWLGTFAPVAAIAALHLLIASRVFSTKVELESWMSGPLETVTASTVAVVALVIAAYAISPFTPLFRSFLDGTRLPGFVRHPLRRARYQAAHRARRRLARLNARLSDLQKLRDTSATDLEAAAEAGADQPPPSAAQNDAMARVIGRLLTVLGTAQPPLVDDLRTAHTALEALLRAHSAEAEDPQSERLDRLWTEFGDLLDASVGLADTEFNLQMSRSQLHWRLPASEATAVGDTRQAAERYSELMYGVSFEYLWPRLQVGLDDKPDDAKAFDAARTQIDFAVLALVLSMTVPVVWLPLMGLHGRSLPELLGVAAFGPLAWIFFYQLVVQSQSAFGSVVQAMIDRRRLSVLTAMCLPRPNNTGEERDLWRVLEAGEQGAPPSLRYQEHAEAPGQ